ncbi:hypothetical protein [Streptomyces sp. G1]|uniref:hypothetical protein n=1 Tax=Streptomyces sp. G1 TaxID=361572 RepID=UPI00202FA775|nr:hypothetical protein [Streptomyces sp. G1]MCM1964895.1 hypothetical protein [Streptomyces sp. G1]
MQLTPIYDAEREVWHLAEAGGVIWDMVPMLTTFALTGTPDGDRLHGYRWRWCFKTELELLCSAGVFDPDTMDEPPGYLKRKGEERQAPRRDALPEYNRPKCVHGRYLDVRDCVHIACPGWTP